MVELAAVAVVFAAIVSLVLGLFWRAEGSSALSARLAGLKGEQTAFSHQAPVRESLGSRVILPLADSLGATIASLLPNRWAKAVESELVRAGRPISVSGFFGVVAISGAAAAAIALTLALSAGMTGGLSTLMVGAAALVGLYFPRLWLANRVRFRQKEIVTSLPDAFDLITVCVEAGLGLEAALAKVAEKAGGAFGEELALTLREIAMGRLRREALKEMAQRTGVPDLTTFINAVVQAESMGTSIATVLRVQADNMRVKRRQRAEQAAHQAPIKMMFPLVLCIFPTLMVVILGPAVISIYQQLTSRN